MKKEPGKGSGENQQAATAVANGPMRGRTPQRERGRRRVDAILDAASAIIVEEGLVGLSVDAIAKRSGTSKSSMYHFFRDVESVIEALAERYAASLHQSNEALLNETVDWAGMNIEQTVDRFVEPFHAYLDEHPDFLLVIHTVRESGHEFPAKNRAATLAIERAERIIMVRTPLAKPAERRLRAVMMFATVLGVLHVSGHVPKPPVATLMRELKKVLIMYLSALEAADVKA